MNIRTLSTLATLAILTSCTTTNLWNHPTNDEAQFTQDRYVCIKDGEQHAANLGFNGNPMIVADRARECMQIQGYTVTKAPRMAAAPTESPKRSTPD